MTTDRNKVRCAVEVFLDAKRVTLFLDWDITTDTGKAKAIEYLTDLYLDLEEQIAKQFKPEVAPDKGYGGTVPAAFVEGVTEAMDVEAERNWQASTDDGGPMWDARTQQPTPFGRRMASQARAAHPLTFGMGVTSFAQRSDVIETTGSVADETLRPLRHTSRTPSTFLPTPELRGPGRDAGL